MRGLKPGKRRFEKRFTHSNFPLRRRNYGILMATDFNLHPLNLSRMEIPGSVSDLLRHKAPDLYTIKPDDTVIDAIKRMAENNVGALLVMSRKKLKGIISERDYTRNVILKGRSSKKVQVKEIMTDRLICVSPENTINEALRLMTDERIRHLPVLEGERVMGVLSIGDLIKWVISSQDAALQQLENYVSSGGYPG